MNLMVWQAFALSLRLATITTVILLATAVPLASLLVLGRSRWLAALEALATLPTVLPPTVLGFFLLVLLGPRTAVGRGIATVLGHPLAFSFGGLVVGSVIYSLPFAVQPFTAALASVDRRLLAASASLGASSWRTFWRITFPLALPGIVTGFALSFAHTLGEFGVVLMLGGNIPGRTQTASIAIFDNVQNLDYSTAARQSITLLAISFTLLLAINALSRNRNWGLQ